MLNRKTHLVALMLCSTVLMTACGNSNNEAEKKVEIKPAPKLSNDATTYANAAWDLINQIDPIVYQKQTTEHCVSSAQIGVLM